MFNLNLIYELDDLRWISTSVICNTSFFISCIVTYSYLTSQGLASLRKLVLEQHKVISWWTNQIKTVEKILKLLICLMRREISLPASSWLHSSCNFFAHSSVVCGLIVCCFHVLVRNINISLQIFSQIDSVTGLSIFKGLESSQVCVFEVLHT